jgi:class 3 adenylate cyclase
MARRPWWASTCAAVAVAFLIFPAPPWPLTDPAMAAWVLIVLTLVSAGWILVVRPPQQPNGALMLVMAAVMSSADGLQGLRSGPWQFIGFVLYPMTGVLLGLLLLRWPATTLRTRAEALLMRAAFVGVPLLTFLDAATWDPAWNGYTGPAWWLTVVSDKTVASGAYRANQGYQLALLLVFLVLLGLRFRRSLRPERRGLVPVAISATAFALVAIVEATSAVGGWTSPVSLVLGNVAVLVVPLSLLVSLAVRRIQRALAVEALLQPQRLADPEEVRAVLARALGDRELTLALWSDERGSYLSADGEPVRDGAPGRQMVAITGDDGSPVARIGVDARLAGSADLVEAVARAASVALDNARLQVELRARQREAAESLERLDRAQQTERQLSRLVPGGLADRLRADPTALSRTERLTVTVLMSDIRGYSSIAETTGPTELARQLNQHRQAMNDVILAASGTVMQYVGDAVLAVFGAPDPQPGHEDRALRAAAGMHAAQDRLNEVWALEGLPAFGLGIGICTGEVAAAFLGSAERVEYTVVGDTVNLASRLTDAARPAGTTIASATTVAGADAGWTVHPMPAFQVKGRTTSVSAFRVVGPFAPAVPTA